MKLKVTTLQPRTPARRENPSYRFSIVRRQGERSIHLFTVPASSMRTMSDRNDLRKVTINMLNDASFQQKDITSIVDQLATAFSEIV